MSGTSAIVHPIDANTIFRIGTFTIGTSLSVPLMPTLH
jgi:hypothetical protein